MDEFVLSAQMRTDFGSRAAGRLRESGRLPANIYGHNESNVHFSLDAKQFTSFLNAGHRMLAIRIDDTEEHGVVKEVQYDAMGSAIVHVDFTRVSRDETIEVEVSVELIGVPKGVSSGGVLSFARKEVLVSGFPQDIPESLPLDVHGLEMGEAFRIKDLVRLERCKYVEDDELVVVMVAAPRGVEESVEEGEAGPTEPEVIKQKKDEKAAEDTNT